MVHDVLAWDLAAIPVVVIGGMLLHFCFEWGGRRRVLAVFCPVNESVWEHLKMAYWPLLAFTGVQIAAAQHAPALTVARAIGYYTMCVVILGCYFATAALLPRASLRTRLVLDGATFVLAVAAGQLVSFVVSSANDRPAVSWAGLIALTVPAVVVAVTTFAPPRVELFRDQVTGGYGLRP
ncbi:MAG: DUF6512 family protein [Mycobacterium sp.]